MTNQDRPRIFSHITRSRFLHIEDSLDIGKIRFFIGEYARGSGATATAYHFLDAEDARPLFADLAWGKAADFVDYKGSANGGQPVSRVLKVRGPKDGKYWLEIQNGPGQIIGQGAVKPAGDPDASISIALSLWEARKLALAVIEYMTAYRVATFRAAPAAADIDEDILIEFANLCALYPNEPRAVLWDRAQSPTPSPPRGEGRGGGQSDIEDLFGPAPAPSGTSSPPASPQKPEPADTPASFYALAPTAITGHGLLDLVQELVKAPGSWTEKAARLQAAMS